MDVFFDDLPKWRTGQEVVLSRGTPVALEHHWNWIRDVSERTHWYAVVPDAEGERVRAAAVARRISTLSLPGHHRLRLTRFGHGLEADDVAAILEGFRELVDREGRLLSLNIEVFTPDPDHLQRIGGIAADLGFERVRDERRYRWTARLDLTHSEERLFANLSRSCRRGIREPEKEGFRIDDIADDRWVGRMNALWKETFHRTGAIPPFRDWARRLAFARAHPDLYRIVGAFAPDTSEPESLVAFACGMHNGDHATYSDGASTRDIDSSISLSYTPVWRLILWARARGCAWFDMGGISNPVEAPGDDPREGISDFKRRFADDSVEVGAEWSYTPPSIRNWLADRMRHSGKGIRTLLSRGRP